MVDWKAAFWKNVSDTRVGECLEWIGNKDSSGYGRMKVNGKYVRASRIAWEISNGPIPIGFGYHGICVLHRCDNRLCVNPVHLFLGTQTDNAADMNAKGRHARKLSDAAVIAIRGMSGTHKSIAELFCVSRATVTHIKQGMTWKQV